MLFILFIVHRSEFDLQEAKFYLYPKKKNLYSSLFTQESCSHIKIQLLRELWIIDKYKVEECY